MGGTHGEWLKEIASNLAPLCQLEKNLPIGVRLSPNAEGHSKVAGTHGESLKDVASDLARAKPAIARGSITDSAPPACPLLLQQHVSAGVCVCVRERARKSVSEREREGGSESACERERAEES